MHLDGSGILTLLNNKVFNCILIEDGKGYVVIVGDYILDWGGQVARVGIINVYSSCSNNDKLVLWDHIGHVKSNYNSIAWCVVGDFNAVRHYKERQGIGHARVNKIEVKGFDAFIDDNKLFDLPIVGRKFIWYRPNGITKSRLDRVLVSDLWLQIWPESR